jgi:hypothetical protein
MRTIALLFSLVFIFLSCTKEDIESKGTFQTFRQKLCGTWKLKESSTNGNPDNLAGIDAEITFDNNGTFYQLVLLDFGGSTFSTEDNGNWYITDNRTTLVITPITNGNTWAATITKLTSKELILTDSSSGDTTVQSYEKM